MKTLLQDRVLWYDGDLTFTPEQLYDFVLGGGSINDKIHIDALNAEIESFNKLNKQNLTVKKNLKDLDKTWNIPEEYKNLDLKKYIYKRLLEKVEDTELSDDEIRKRIERVNIELELFHKYNMSIVLRTIIYIVDQFEKNDVVWGTGRGSSCSSYILHVVGLHDVDSVEYDLDLDEFFR